MSAQVTLLLAPSWTCVEMLGLESAPEKREREGGREEGRERTMFLSAHSTARDEHMWRTAAFEAL